MDNRGMDSDPGWVNRKFRELERAIEALRSERRAGATTISNGSLDIDGGDVIMRDVDGSIIFRLGTQTHGDRGMTLNRDDGTLVLTTAKPFSNSTVQRWKMSDTSGNMVVAEAVIGTGLETPYLPLPVQPVGTAGSTALCGPFGLEVSVTSGTFVDVFRWQGRRQNPYFRPSFNVRHGDLTTASEVRVVDAAGVVRNGFFQPDWIGVVALGSTADTLLEPPYGLIASGSYGASSVLRVQARRTAGAGTLHVAVRQFEGGPA